MRSKFDVKDSTGRKIGSVERTTSAADYGAAVAVAGALAYRGVKALNQGKSNRIFNAARQHLDKGEVDAALDLLSGQAKSKNKADRAYALMLRGQALLYDDDAESALIEFNALVTLIQQSAQEALPEDLSYAYAMRGLCYLALDKLQEALSDAKLATDAGTEHPFAQHVFQLRSLALTQLGDYEQAVVYADRLVHLVPDSAEAYFVRAVIYGKLGDRNRSEADFDRALRLAPNNADLYRRRAEFHRSHGNFDHAIQDATQAIRISPTNFHYQLRADLYEQIGDQVKQKADLLHVIEADPRDDMFNAYLKGATQLYRKNVRRRYTDNDRYKGGNYIVPVMVCVVIFTILGAVGFVARLEPLFIVSVIWGPIITVGMIFGIRSNAQEERKRAAVYLAHVEQTSANLPLFETFFDQFLDYMKNQTISLDELRARFLADTVTYSLK